LRTGDGSLEALNVQLIVALEPQSVSRWSCLDPFRSEALPEGRDMTVQRLMRRLGRALAPQPDRQIVDRNHLADPKEQEREQCALLRPHGREIHAVRFHLELAEEPELHSR
jgi:hypothetical protein